MFFAGLTTPGPLHRHADIKTRAGLHHSGFFNLDEPNLYKPIWDSLLNWGDCYFISLISIRTWLARPPWIERTAITTSGRAWAL